MAKKNETKLSAAFAKQLKGMGFNCKSEEDARKQLLAALEKEGIDGMEDESLQTLIDMVSGWRDTEDPDEEVDETEEDEEEVDEDEQDAEDLADEVEEEDAEEAETEEDEESDETEDEEEETEEDEEETDEEDEEPEEEQKPAKKATKKSVAEKPKKKETVTTKEAVEKKPSKRNSKKLDPKNNENDRQELIDAFSKMFPTDTYLYAFVINGVSIKYIGKNSKRGVFLYDNLTRHEDGTISGNLYLNTMTKETDKLDELGIDYQLCWTNAPFVKAVTPEEANDILEKVFEIITSFVSKVDKRLGDNRKKMEESLEKAGKKSEKPTEKKKAAKPASEVEEQEVKKPAKKTVAKKSVTNKKTKK